VEKLDSNSLSKCIEKGDKRGTKISKIDGDLGGTSFKKILNPKVEQSKISNLDLEPCNGNMCGRPLTTI
jgi:hypothetical protein